MIKYEITPQFISSTIIETYLYGYYYKPKKSAKLLEYLKKHIPKKTVNYNLDIFTYLCKILGPYDVFTEFYYITVFDFVYKNNTTIENIELLSDIINNKTNT